MTGRKSRLLWVLILGIFATAVIYFFWRVDIGGFLNALGKANYFFVLLAFGVYLFTVIIYAARWRISLSATGHNIGLRDLWLTVSGSIFVNNITPFTFSGGDPLARIILLRKTQRVPYSLGSASVITEYLLDLPVSISILMAGILLYFRGVLARLVVGIVWIAVMISLLLFILYFLPRRAGAGWLDRTSKRILKAFRRPISQRKITGEVTRFYTSA